MKKYFVFFIFFAALGSCTYDSKSLSDGPPEDCVPETVTFTKDIQPLMNTYCTGCHGNTFPSAGLSLVTYAQVRDATENGNLLVRTQLPSSNPQSMPPSAGLSDCKNEILQAWVAQGFVEN
ncbi:MAG: hypothetical protein LAT76_04515 [Schleiferiaceae bacterium]|nr:hypothetical protein [Schleiferiaceae bacterium]